MIRGEQGLRAAGGLGRGAALALAVAMGAACAPPPPRHLVVISLDTARRDHVSAYGYARPTTPQIDALSERAAVFLNAFTQSTLTGPSHASLFTGLSPPTHGYWTNRHRLAATHVTLAEVLRGRGFRTAGFVSGYPLTAQASGLDRGFEVYDDELDAGQAGSTLRHYRRAAARTFARAARWLDARDAGRERLFLFVHAYDAHGPYLPGKAYLDTFRSAGRGPELASIPPYQQLAASNGLLELHLTEYVDRYDAQLRCVDDQIGALLGRFDLEETIVVVLADHGETLGERDWSLDHGSRVVQEQIRIPLIVFVPGREPVRLAKRAQTVDLAPSLLALLGVAPPDGLAFEGLASLVAPDASADGDRLVFASSGTEAGPFPKPGYALDTARPTLTVQDARWKLVQYPGLERDFLELFDLREDPGERRDVAARWPGIRDALHAELRAWARNPEGAAPAAPLSPEDAAKLRALGYAD